MTESKRPFILSEFFDGVRHAAADIDTEVIAMEKKKDWGALPFAYTPLKSRYEAVYKDGRWFENGLVTDADIKISESAAVFQYAQTCFEGLKAYRTESGEIVMFRPDLNAKRFQDSCRRLLIPEITEEMFIRAVDMTVRDNAGSVPPYGSGATLYIRPFVIGSSPVLGVAPAKEYIFRVFGSPVGTYFKGGIKPITLTVSDYDRAAPRGTGGIKAGINYAMSLYAGGKAHAAGFAENLYLDPGTRSRVEETGGANLIFVTKDNKLVTPKSPSILPSVTRRSVLTIGRQYLGLEAEEREVYFSELDDFAECGICGTAAVICPVGAINDHGRIISFDSGMDEAGPVCRRLYETLTGIQMGRLPAPEGWIHRVM